MAKVSQFEDLFAWQQARVLMQEIYRITKSPLFERDYRLAGQIQAAAVSVMANIAEGFDRGRRAEFHQFLSIAKGSCGEVRSHLYVASDVGYINKEEFERLKIFSIRVSGLINLLRQSIEGWDNSKSKNA
jgi:four helix bundle protein